MSQIFGSNELTEDVLNRDLCIGCGACTDLCPYMRNYKGKTTRLFPCDLPQGRCFAHCPKAEVDLDELSRHWRGKAYTGAPLGEYRTILAARAGSRFSKGRFQSGGTVSALMAFALETGVIDAAVLTDREGLIPRPRLVTDTKGVMACAASKFTAAPTLSALNRGITEGYTRMGVAGTPCQMTALAQMRRNPLEREDFTDPVALSVGLFCTWALDTRGLLQFLPQCVDAECVLGMDVPPPPRSVMVVDTGTEAVEIPLEQIRPLIPRTCFICPDMTAEWSDLSVGNIESRPGWNTLIVRTDRGRDQVDEAVRQGYLETGPMATEDLEALCRAAAAKKRRSFTHADRQGLVNTAEEGKRAAVRVSEAVLKSIIGGEKEESCHA